MMSTKTLQKQAYEQIIVSSQRALPVAHYPSKYVHAAFDILEDAVRAVQELRMVGYDAGDVSLMASWDFVEAVEAEPQHPRCFSEALLGFLSFLDDNFNVYLREARAGRHILAVHVARHENIMQVRDILAPHNARLMKYIDTWTVADLSS